MDVSVPRAVDATMTADRRGWLLLRSGGDWQQHWFTLQGNAIKYAVNESSPDAGSISLEGSSVELVPDERYGRQFCFELRCAADSQTYSLVAPNATELQEWMNVIRRTMLRIRRDKAKLAAQSRRQNRDDQQQQQQQQQGANRTAVGASNPLGPLSPASGGYSGSNGYASGPSSFTSSSSSSSASPYTGFGSSASNGSSSSSSFSSSSSSSSSSSFPSSSAGYSDAMSGGKAKYDVYRQWLDESSDSRRPQRQPVRDARSGCCVIS